MRSYSYYRMRPSFFQRAAEMNEYMSKYVFELISIEFMKISKSLNNSVITFIGLENNQIDPAFSSSSSFSVIERIATLELRCDIMIRTSQRLPLRPALSIVRSQFRIQ